MQPPPIAAHRPAETQQVTRAAHAISSAVNKFRSVHAARIDGSGPCPLGSFLVGGCRHLRLCCVYHDGSLPVDVTVKVQYQLAHIYHFSKPPLGPLRLEEDIFSGIIHVHSRFTKCT